jgi:energy-coupling factor transport system ATP-binding protein
MASSRSDTPLGRTDAIVEVHDLTISYGNKDAIKNVSSTFFAAEIVAVMGRNGAGKSSLLESIVGAIKASSGTVTVASKNPFTLKASERRKTIGYVPQEPSDLLFGSSVEAECTQADSSNALEPGTTFSFLSRLTPTVSLATHPHDLSEGQRLALVLSIVLSSNPEVLVLDEPTRGLDYQAKNLLAIALKEFAANFGRPVLLATHDVELVAELADRVLFLAEGEIVADGSTLDVLLSSPAFAPQVAKIMAPAPWLTVDDVIHGLNLKSL